MLRFWEARTLIFAGRHSVCSTFRKVGFKDCTWNSKTQRDWTVTFQRTLGGASKGGGRGGVNPSPDLRSWKAKFAKGTDTRRLHALRPRASADFLITKFQIQLPALTHYNAAEDTPLHLFNILNVDIWSASFYSY